MNHHTLSGTRLERLRSVLSGYVERCEIPGLVALVCRRGEAHTEAMGALSLGGRPVRLDSIFRLSSMTKPVTAVAAVILVEECKLRLDEPVERLLPELANRRVLRRLDGPVDDTVPAVRPITVRDLLTFRLGFGLIVGSPETHPILRAVAAAGLPYGPPAPAAAPAPDEWLRRFASLPLMAQPGERWLYNTGSELLGVLIARASGHPFEVFLRERIFEPLGMKDTAFWVPADRLERFATCYQAAPGERVYDEAAGGQWSRPPAFASGADGLVSTAVDYLAFGQMLLQGGRLGHERVLSRPSVELMTTDQLTAEQKARSGLLPGEFDIQGYGFGVSVCTRRAHPWAPVGQFGWDGGLGTVWRSDPREDMVTILMTQRAWSSPQPPPVGVDFWNSAYQAIDD